MTAQEIMDTCEAHYNSDANRTGWVRAYGLRALSAHQVDLQAGDDIGNSYQTFDELDEYYELNGSCCIGFERDDEDSIERAIDLIRKYGGNLVIIAIIAGMTCEYGNDPSEWIIGNAEIVHRF